MNEISINNPRNVPLKPVCQRHRQLVVKGSDLFRIAEVFASVDRPISRGVSPQSKKKASAERAARHIRSCQDCRRWVHRTVPKDLLSRARRIGCYCCVFMHDDIEKHSDKPMISTVCYDGDTWFRFCDVDIFYCPWCGKRLPVEPFINSSKLKKSR